MKDNRYEIRLSGSGGQGIILASVILADAAGLRNDMYVAQTQSYGPEARGGKCKAEVVISSTAIDYPKVLKVDLLLAMNQAACDAFFYDFKPNGILLVDADLVTQMPTTRVISIPFTRIAKETTGKDIAANMMALGAIGHLCPRISLASLEKALKTRIPPGTKEMNIKAMRAGAAAAKAINTSLLPRSIIPEEDEEI